MIQSTKLRSALLIAIAIAFLQMAYCRSVATNTDDDSVSAVIPSPNQDFGDEATVEIRRSGSPASMTEPQQQGSNVVPATTPIYASPFVRSERTARAALAPASFERQESSHAPPNYAPRPSASEAHSATKDLKAAASYGHHHGHQGYDSSGWLDMGAWTGGKGSFGWYADYPVGGKHAYGYGRK